MELLMNNVKQDLKEMSETIAKLEKVLDHLQIPPETRALLKNMQSDYSRSLARNKR